MAVKIYASGGAVIVRDGVTGEYITVINSNQFDWALSGANFFSVRDGIENRSYQLGQFADVQNEAGTPYTSIAELTDALNGLVGKAGTTVLGGNALGADAWGRQKVYMDNSILHGMFTTSVPVATWKETYNGVEQAPTVSTSVNGKLSHKAGATLNDVNVLDTYRNPRYEPNRGHLYSTAVFLPLKTASGVREFGIFTEYSGVFFRLKSDGNLYAVVRTTVNSVTTDNEQLIDTTGIDIEKGNVYDIQFQWRGVGNYSFFINLKKVYAFEFLGTLSELTMFNPALPIAFRAENLGDNVEIQCGCVDVTSEGGKANGKIYGSVSIDNQSGQVAVTGYNTPVLAVRSKPTVGGLRNTRDTLALLLSAYSDQRSFVRVWATRDFTAITENDQAWQDFGDGHLEYISYDVPDITTPMTFDTAKAELIFGCRVGIDETYSTSALFEGRTDIWLTPGDLFVFTIHRENALAANVGATFEFAEEI